MEREVDNRQELLARLTERLEPLIIPVGVDGIAAEHWQSISSMGGGRAGARGAPRGREGDPTGPPLQAGTLHVVVMDAELLHVPSGGLNSNVVSVGCVSWCYAHIAYVSHHTLYTTRYTTRYTTLYTNHTHIFHNHHHQPTTTHHTTACLCTMSAQHGRHQWSPHT